MVLSVLAAKSLDLGAPSCGSVVINMSLPSGSSRFEVGRKAPRRAIWTVGPKWYFLGWSQLGLARPHYVPYLVPLGPCPSSSLTHVIIHALLSLLYRALEISMVPKREFSTLPGHLQKVNLREDVGTYEGGE